MFDQPPTQAKDDNDDKNVALSKLFTAEVTKIDKYASVDDYFSTC